MSDDLTTHLTRRSTWLKGLYILLFAIIYSISKIVVAAVVILQFLVILVTGTANPRLLKFGQSLSSYIYQILMFVTANIDDRPWPFNPWPSGPPPRKPRRTANADTNRAVAHSKEQMDE